MNALLRPIRFGNDTSSFVTDVFRVFVDETQSVEDLINLGNFCWRDKDVVSKNFPKPTNGQISEKGIALFHFNRTMFSRNVIDEINREGRRLANVWEIISLAIKEPDLYKKFPIVAFGSSPDIDGRQRVVCIRKSLVENDHGIFLYSMGDVWNDSFRFAAI